MVLRFLLAALVPALCLAQAPEIPTNPKILDELKSIRTSEAATNQKILDELKSIRELLERQEVVVSALLALIRIQIDESQVTALEGQRLRLSAQEQDLNKEVSRTIRSTSSSPPMVQSEDGSVRPATQSEASPIAAQMEQASSQLSEVQRSRRTLEGEITRLKGRIAAMEKILEETLQTLGKK